MIKMLKKFLLLAVLVANLFKKLIVGLTLFLYNRTFGSKWGVIMGVAGVAMILLVTTFVFIPKNFASDTAIQKDVSASLQTSVTQIEETGRKIAQTMDVDELSDLLAEAQEDDMATIEESLQEADAAINFQAQEVTPATGSSTGSGEVGRQEPFAPTFGPSGMIVGPGPNPEALSDAELAKIAKEQREQEIRDALANDVNLKGTVINADRTNPLAIMEVIRSDGETETKTFKEGDSIYISTGEAKIKKIHEYGVTLMSEEVKVERGLPEFPDDNVIPVADTPEPPAAPGAAPADPKKDPGAVGEARKKIEDIDELLNSF